MLVAYTRNEQLRTPAQGTARFFSVPLETGAPNGPPSTAVAMKYSPIGPVDGAVHETVMLPVVGPPTAARLRTADGADAASAPLGAARGTSVPPTTAITARGVRRRHELRDAARTFSAPQTSHPEQGNATS